MAYTAPTAADLKARFPAFAAVDDDVVTSALVESESLVDESWTEADFAQARMLYAAHIMTLDGHGTGPAGSVAGLSGVTRIKSGALDLSFSEAAATASVLDKTTYGQRFKAMQRRNKPLALTGGYIAPCHPLAFDC